MMPSWCQQVNWGNCGIPWVNCRRPERTVLSPVLVPVKTAQFTQFFHQVWCNTVKSSSLTGECIGRFINGHQKHTLVSIKLIWCHRTHTCWQFITGDTLKNWRQKAKLLQPACLMKCWLQVWRIKTTIPRYSMHMHGSHTNQFFMRIIQPLFIPRAVCITCHWNICIYNIFLIHNNALNLQVMNFCGNYLRT